MHALFAHADTRIKFMKNVNIRLTAQVDSLCDYTFNFHYLNQKLDPDSLIPDQAESSYTYQDLVDALKDGADVHIKGDVGERLAYSMGADLKHLGGSGRPKPAGRVFVDGSVGSKAGMGMVAGALYINGIVPEPLGNIIEVFLTLELSELIFHVNCWKSPHLETFKLRK